jgi:hypothetical protein
MKIDANDLHYGAALKQIADDPSFKSINADRDGGNKSRCSFRINTDIGVYIRSGGEPKTRFKHYVFNFKQDNLREIAALASRCPKTFIVLVCLKDAEICMIRHQKLLDLIELRRRDIGGDEEQYNIQVTIPKDQSMRVYMNKSGSKTLIVGQRPITVPRNAFPKRIFV